MQRLNLFPAERQQRQLALVFLVNCLGNGMYLPVALLFLTKVGGWTAPRVGLAFTIGGAVAVFVSAAVGYAADRHGPRELAAALLATEGVAIASTCSLYWSRSYPLLVFILSVSAGANTGGRAAWGVLIARVAGEDRIALRAQLRALSNIAIGAGALVAAVGLTRNGSTSYLALVLSNAASFMVAAVLLLRLPHYAPVRKPAGGPRLPVLGDVTFAATCCLNVVLSWQYWVPSLVLPLWIVQYTAAPRWMAGAVLALNTVLIAGLQSTATRRVTQVYGAAGGLRRAGVLFLAACIGFALTGRVSAVSACALLLAAAALHTAGELWHASAAFEIPYAAAPEHAVGEYQGVFELAHGVSSVSAPAVLTGLCIAGGAGGWLALGALFAGSALAASTVLDRRAPVGRYVEHDRRPV
jgi:Major Facilitator Superfamily